MIRTLGMLNSPDRSAAAVSGRSRNDNANPSRSVADRRDTPSATPISAAATSAASTHPDDSAPATIQPGAS